MQNTNSLLLRGFRDFLESSYANALDDKHFSSNAGDAMRGRGETKYREENTNMNMSPPLIVLATPLALAQR